MADRVAAMVTDREEMATAQGPELLSPDLHQTFPSNSQKETYPQKTTVIPKIPKTKQNRKRNVHKKYLKLAGACAAPACALRELSLAG